MSSGGLDWARPVCWLVCLVVSQGTFIILLLGRTIKKGGGVFVHPSICLSVHQPVRDAEVPDLQSLRSWHPAPGQQVGVHPHVIYVVERWTVSEMPRSQVCHPRRSTRAHTHMAQPLSRYRIVHLLARVPSSPFAASTLGSPPAPGNHWLCFVSL